MNIQVQSADAAARRAFDMVAPELGLAAGASGREIAMVSGTQGLSLESAGAGQKITLSYDSVPNLCRALSRVASFGFGRLTETRAFENFGIMIDCSRNAVPTVQTVELLLRRMAIMGYTQLMLYMEDTYEVPEHPYFGHLRGRFSQAELRRIDDYAADLGIEVVPCIQTLAHLQRFLLWPKYAHLTDTPEILLVGDEEVYALLEDMIRAATAPFRSKKVHVGMDEAHGLGLGHYLKLHGPRDRFAILNEHLDRVAAIVAKLGKMPIIWSDMFFRLVDPSGDYTADIDAEAVGKGIPDSMQLVYWDYFTDDIDFYRRKLAQHEAMKPGTMFAGGVWTWNGLAHCHSRTMNTTVPAFAACREAGIRDVLMTMWGDDGQEVPFLQGLYGLQTAAELAYDVGGDFELATGAGAGQTGAGDPARGAGFRNTIQQTGAGAQQPAAPDHQRAAAHQSAVPTHPSQVDWDEVSRRFAETHGADPAAFIALDRIDNLSGAPWSNLSATTGKLAFYQDLLLGLFDAHLDGIGAAEHYAKLAGEFERAASAEQNFADLFAAPAALCRVLELKAELGLKLKKFYDAGDRAGLGEAVPVIRQVIQRLEVFHRAYRDQWQKYFKPFGYEVLDTRFGGLAVRLDYAVWRIEEYLAGNLAEIPELAAPRLRYDGRPTDAPKHIRFNYWHRMVTAGNIGHNLY